ncbi:MAG: response regulator [Deltaproteobacteria bacterium]|nr:response regulator [Deltaproteobacteria bacterium]
MAEDSKLLLQLIQDALLAHNLGHAVVVCPDGAKLVDLVEDRLCMGKRTALYLLDIVMPGLDGIAAARRLRELEAQRGVKPAPILFYSQRESDAEIEQAVEACWPARFVHKQSGARADQLAMAVIKLLEDLGTDAG